MNMTSEGIHKIHIQLTGRILAFPLLSLLLVLLSILMFLAFIILLSHLSAGCQKLLMAMLILFYPLMLIFPMMLLLYLFGFCRYYLFKKKNPIDCCERSGFFIRPPKLVPSMTQNKLILWNVSSLHLKMFLKL